MARACRQLGTDTTYPSLANKKILNKRMKVLTNKVNRIECVYRVE